MLRRYRRELPIYWRETSGLRDFARLVRVRLSRSKIGWLACPRRTVLEVNLTSCGGPVLVRSHSTDISVLRELLLGRTYEAASAALADQPTIIDLGANTGLAARWLQARHPGAKVFCVEPEPENASLLEENLKRGRSAYVVYRACIGKTRRAVRLTSSSGSWGFAMVEVGEADGELVRVIKLDDVLDDVGPPTVDLLKCDIEGAERELFEDCAAWIRRVRLAVIECHDDFHAADCIELIVSAGGLFDVVDLDVNDGARPYETVTLRNLAFSH